MDWFKAVIDDIEAVPEEYRDIYEDGKDGGHVIKPSLLAGHPAITNIKATADRLDKDKRDLAKKLADAEKRLADLPDDFDPEEYERIKEAMESGDDKDKDEARQRAFQKRVEAMERKHQAELEEREAAVTAKDGVIHRLLVEDGLTKALVEAGVGKEFMRAAKALLKEQVKVVEDGGEYRAVVDTDIGEADVAKYVADWAQGEEGKPFVPAPKGADAKGNNGTRGGEANPWKDDTFNLTAQGAIVRSDRSKAERLMRAAGKSDQQIRATLGG